RAAFLFPKEWNRHGNRVQHNPAAIIEAQLRVEWLHGRERWHAHIFLLLRYFPHIDHLTPGLCTLGKKLFPVFPSLWDVCMELKFRCRSFLDKGRIAKLRI